MAVGAVEWWPLEKILPYARNAKTHDEAGVAQLAGMIKEFGWTYPILVDEEGVILAGHKRRRACERLGLQQAPVLVKRGLNAHQKQAYRIADNKTTENSAWDEGLLKIEIGELKAAGTDLGLTAFSDEELKTLWGVEETPAEDPGPQVDRAEELREKWQVEPGQLWQLGEHRLICGDCTDPAVVARVMGGEKAALLFDDPPYGVERDEGFGGFGGFGPPIARRQYADDWDSERPSKETFDLHLGQATSAIIFGGNFFADILPQSTHWIVWDKLNTMPTFGDCELAWTNFGRKSVKKITFQYNGLIGKEKERFHPTQKPVGLYAEILQEYSKAGDLIFDPFCGSGTTLIACEQLGRKCRAVEIAPAYVAVALERWADMTGLTPEVVEEKAPTIAGAGK